MIESPVLRVTGQAFIILLISYLLLEVSYSTLYVTGVVAPAEPFWISEHSDRTVHFDPILGYRLTQTPARIAKITDGQVEFSGVLQGNAQGFADDQDFSARPNDPLRRRIAVLGDSFTAAQYLEYDWTERIEDKSKTAGQPVELLNLAIAGGGLANWWSILQKFLQAENYVVDGLIFAVFEGDLHRSFSLAEHDGYRQQQFGRVPSWDPTQWPLTLTEARTYLQPLRGFILSHDEFEQALSGRWLPQDPRPPWRPYAAKSLIAIARPWFAAVTPTVTGPPPLTAEQMLLIDEIASYARVRSLPVMVASIPSRESLLSATPTPDDVRQFAEALNALFIDGDQVFAGLSAAEIRAHWLPVDGHWGQSGSDRFADAIWQAMQNWP